MSHHHRLLPLPMVRTGPNGVFTYGLGGGFPNLATGSMVNYWVDVVFSDTAPADNAAPTVNSVSPVKFPAANVTPGLTIQLLSAKQSIQATIPTGTFELRDSLSTLVPALVTYNVCT